MKKHKIQVNTVSTKAKANYNDLRYFRSCHTISWLSTGIMLLFVLFLQLFCITSLLWKQTFVVFSQFFVYNNFTQIWNVPLFTKYMNSWITCHVHWYIACRPRQSLFNLINQHIAINIFKANCWVKKIFLSERMDIICITKLLNFCTISFEKNQNKILNQLLSNCSRYNHHL